MKLTKETRKEILSYFKGKTEEEASEILQKLILKDKFNAEKQIEVFLEKLNSEQKEKIFEGFETAKMIDEYIFNFGEFNGDTITYQRTIILSSIPYPMSLLIK